MSMPKRKTLKVKKTLPKPKLQVAMPTKAELKRAYQLVTQDLFNKLIKAKDKDKVTIGAMGSLGAFHKAERKVKSGIQPKGMKGKPKLNTYVYYAVRFKPSRSLKEELNNSLEKKYK